MLNMSVAVWSVDAPLAGHTVLKNRAHSPIDRPPLLLPSPFLYYAPWWAGLDKRRGWDFSGADVCVYMYGCALDT